MKKFSEQKGFTLVEIIVSMAIFSVVALVAVGAFLKVMDANRKSISLKTTINNLNFALESMTREMRVGKNYSCKVGVTVPISFDSIDCPTSNGIENWVITFTSSKQSSDGVCKLKYAYRYINHSLEKAQQTNCGDSLVFAPLISSEVVINSAIINVSGTQTADTQQPKIFLYIKGVSGVKNKDKTEFSLQTTISQRLPN